MKHIYLLLLTCIISLALPAQDTAPKSFDYKRDFKAILEKTQDAESGLAYKKLLPRFLDRDSSLSNAEMLALLIGFTENPQYKPFEDMQTEQEIFDLNEEGNHDSALLKAQIFLRKHPLSMRVLKEASYVYHVKKMDDSANYYMDLVDKIMAAMKYSGSGKNPESPIFSLGLTDGEQYIPNIGMKVLNRDTEWNSNNHFLEVIDASKSIDDHINYYFVIQHAKEKIDDDKVSESDQNNFKKGKKKKDKKEKDKKDKKSKPADPQPAPKTE